MVLITGTTQTNVNGTSIVVITLPSGYNMKKTYFYAGSYGNTFVGEGTCNGDTVRMNISASTNNGVFQAVAVLD